MLCHTFFLLSCLLLGAVGQTQRAFQADIVAYDDPDILGTLTGTVLYDANVEKVRFDWAIGVTEIIHFEESLRYLLCSNNCSTETFNIPLWEFHTEGATPAGSSQTINGRTCSPFQKSAAQNAPDNRIDIVWADDDIICRVEFFQPAGQPTARTFDFLNHVAIPSNSETLLNAVDNCPAQQCSKKITFNLIFDESGSVDQDNFELMQEFAIALANSYTFGVNYVGMGLTLFSTTARQWVDITFSKSSFINGVEDASRAGDYTCIGCGINTAVEALNDSPDRPDATVVFIVLTDGENNEPDDDDDMSPAEHLNLAVQTAKSAGITFFSIAVDKADEDEVEAIASVIPGVTTFFTSPDFSQLADILDSLIVSTCLDLPGNPCSNCEGFCACGGDCICPDVCDDNNACTTESCPTTGPDSTFGCVYEQVICSDGDECTVDGVCDPQQGCLFPAVDCDDGEPCTDDSCNPSVPGGCQYFSTDCDDTDMCTLDSCEPGVGCQHEPITDEFFCTCSDPDPCEFIPCYEGACSEELEGDCEYIEKDCDDRNACSVDSCNEDTNQCENEPVNCDTGNRCEHHRCDPVSGCYHVPFNVTEGGDCDDKNACTVDSCDPDIGCIHTARDCSDGDHCTDDLCHTKFGCQNPPTDCMEIEEIANLVNSGKCYQALCSNSRDPPGCYPKLNEGAEINRCGLCDTPENEDNCPDPIDSKAAIGIGAGVIAAIVIGVVIVCAAVGAFGGKKGYDIWLNKRTNMAAASTNPLYDGEDLSGTNPMYDGGSA